MTAKGDILALFAADDIVLRPSEILRRVKRPENTVRKALNRLVDEGKLFHIAHSQYARTKCAPIAKMRSERIAALERRVDNLESLLHLHLEGLGWVP